MFRNRNFQHVMSYVLMSFISLGLVMTLVLASAGAGHASDGQTITVDVHPTQYKTVQVGEIEVFYREAGSPGNPVLLLLHGFPTSSHMYRNLIPLLADEYHVFAPDMPGFGSTKAPPRGQYDYTFDNLYKAMEGFTEALSLDTYAMYVFDYGAPIGFRMAAAHPDRVTAIISQNVNAYEQGITQAWQPFRTYWKTGADVDRDALRGILTEETTHWQYTHGVDEARLHLISPDAVAHDQAILDRDNELQLDLFRDYRTNVALYPDWQAYMRAHRPPLLAVWGANDPFFAKEGALAFKQDLPDAEVVLYNSGHFALESHGTEIAAQIKAFLRRALAEN